MTVVLWILPQSCPLLEAWGRTAGVFWSACPLCGQIQEELARWEERKRWQRACDRLKARLREREADCERHQAAAAALRDTVHRLERERAVYETKIRTLTGQ